MYRTKDEDVFSPQKNKVHLSHSWFQLAALANIFSISQSFKSAICSWEASDPRYHWASYRYPPSTERRGRERKVPGIETSEYATLLKKMGKSKGKRLIVRKKLTKGSGSIDFCTKLQCKKLEEKNQGPSKSKKKKTRKKRR